MLNNFCIIIGTKKGATSSLYEYIRQHPSIVGGFKKEPNYFGHIKNWEKGKEWYQRQFVGYKKEIHSYGIDATTDYTQEGFIDIPRRMKNSGFDFKFIYIIRDPFSKIESQTHQFLIDGDTIRPIYECLDTRIIESAKYCKQLEKYLEFFPREQFLLIDFDRIKNDLNNVMLEVNEFLELSDHEYDLSHIHNLKSSAIGQSFKGYRLLRTGLRRLKLTPLIPQIAKDKFRTILGKYGGRNVPRDAYTLTDRQKEFILSEMGLEEDINRLEQKFGFKVKVGNHK